MSIPNTSHIVEATVQASLNDQTVLNIMHYFNPTGGTIPTLGWAAAAAQDFYNTYVNVADYRAIFNPLYEIERVAVQVVYPTRYAKGFFQPAAPLAGTRAGTPMPAMSQWSATTMSDASGPGGHGGNRYSGFNIADVDDGEITGVFQAAAINAVTPLYSQITLQALLLDPLIYRKSAPLQSNPIVSFILEDEVRTMRRRVVGRGI